MAFSSSGKYLLCGCSDHHIRLYLLYDTEDSSMIKPELVFSEKLDGMVNSVFFSPESDLFVAITNNCTYVYRRKKKEIFKKLVMTQKDIPKRTTHGL